ncbi:hypothetical protein D9619_005062 [Psilocybe cf. subviscida]|uniref:Uncharacterized protein n=1 Tax=Psilocybe cf. subviscida TaxID=2480587 RepID=A0A8H5BP36_9AGAR|nr:hypothetical protein D9619_005062 [Psilocybe cf. subviscida]
MKFMNIVAEKTPPNIIARQRFASVPTARPSSQGPSSIRPTSFSEEPFRFSESLISFASLIRPQSSTDSPPADTDPISSMSLTQGPPLTFASPTPFSSSPTPNSSSEKFILSTSAQGASGPTSMPISGTTSTTPLAFTAIPTNNLVGPIVGAILGCVVLAGAFIFILRHRRRKYRERRGNDSRHPDPFNTVQIDRYLGNLPISRDSLRKQLGNIVNTGEESLDAPLANGMIASNQTSSIAAGRSSREETRRELRELRELVLRMANSGHWNHSSARLHNRTWIPPSLSHNWL